MTDAPVSSEAAQPPGSARSPELDGVRGLAVLMVLVWHYVPGQIRPEPDSGLRHLATALSLTWSGVDLFFVLSGFLVGGIVLDHRSSANLLKTFYIRRICRIVPLYYAVVLGFVLVDLLDLQWRSIACRRLFENPIPFWSYFPFLQNFFMATAGFGSIWLGMTWTIAVEEQFYLLLPLSLRRMRREVIPFAGAVVIAAAPIFRVVLTEWVGPNAVYTLIPCKADSLMAGVLAAWIMRSGALKAFLSRHTAALGAILAVLGIGAVLLTIKGGNSSGQGMFGALLNSWLAALFSTLILFTLLSPGSLIARFLRFPGLAGVGTLSYGIYLFHQPIVATLHAILFKRPPQMTKLPEVGVTALAAALTFAFAYAAHLWIERPILRYGHSFRY